VINSLEREKLDRIASQILREKAYNLPIYEWMKKHGIGESDYGKILDLMGRNEHVFQHRLFGHHPFYDLPISQPGNIPDFIEHVWLSDAGTKQGLPIIPGDFLKDSGVLEYCSQRTLEWNFVNSFDLLSATLSIYSSYKNCEKYFIEIQSIESFSELAKELGIGVLELALSIKNTNPFLLIGAMFQLLGTLKGVMNDSSKVYFNQINSTYYLTVAEPQLEIEEIVKSYYLKISDLEDDLDKQTESFYLK